MDADTIDRDNLEQHLRAKGQNDNADRVKKELPRKASKKEAKGLLEQLGLDDDVDQLLDQLPGGIGDDIAGKVKDIL